MLEIVIKPSKKITECKLLFLFPNKHFYFTNDFHYSIKNQSENLSIICIPIFSLPYNIKEYFFCSCHFAVLLIGTVIKLKLLNQ